MALGLYLLAAMAMYREIDLSIYSDLPEGMRDAFGLGSVSGVGQLAFGAVYSFVGRTGAVGRGDIDRLVGDRRRGAGRHDDDAARQPRKPDPRAALEDRRAWSRWCTAGAALLWVAAVIAPALLDVSTTVSTSAALMVHMLAIALFFGLLALAIGAWTGSSAAPHRVTPPASWSSPTWPPACCRCVGGLDWLARFFPWYYYSGSDPLNNGVDSGPPRGTVRSPRPLCVAASLVGFRRRDIRERSSGTSLLDGCAESHAPTCVGSPVGFRVRPGFRPSG